MTNLEKQILTEVAQGPTIFSDQRPDAELSAASKLIAKGAITYKRLYTGCGQCVITDFGMDELKKMAPT